MIKFENATNGRFYYLSLTRDLLDDVVLCVVRGGRNHRIRRTLCVASSEEIAHKICAITKKRLSRGYKIVS